MGDGAQTRYLVAEINGEMIQLLDDFAGSNPATRKEQWLCGEGSGLKKFQVKADSLLKRFQRLSPECKLNDLQVERIIELCFVSARDLAVLNKVNKVWRITEELMNIAEMPLPPTDERFSEFFKIKDNGNGIRLSDVNLISICNMLELQCLAPEWLEHHTSLLASVLAEELMMAPSLTDASTDRLFWVAKMLMQMCHLKPAGLQTWSKQSGPDSQMPAQRLLTGLMRIICGTGASFDTCYMSSLALVTFVKVSSEDEGSLRVNSNSLLRYLLGGINSKSQEATVMIGDGSVCIPPLADCSQSECMFAICCYCRAALKVLDEKILLLSEDTPCLIEVILDTISNIQDKTLGVEYQYILLITTWFEMMVCHTCKPLWEPPDGFWSRLETVSQIMWCQISSPVAGAQEQLMRAYQALMKILVSETEKKNSNAIEMHQRLLQSILSAPSHLKARYLVIGAMVQFFGPSQVISDHPALPGELMSCMDTNHLRSVAELVYKQAVTGLSREHKDQETLLGEWKRIWGNTISGGLSSMSSLHRSHVCNYFIPHTLKTIPGSLPVLLSSIDGLEGVSGARKLHASVMILKQAKMKGLLTDSAKMEQASILSAGLCHLDDDIRLDAFSLLVQSRHSCQPFTTRELRQLKDFIFNNLDSDNTAFRNGFITGVKNALYRIRDGLSPLVRKLTSPSLKGGFGVSEKDELHRRLLENGAAIDEVFLKCLSSLFPGACYQRMKSALDILTHLFQCFLKPVGNDRKLKKGISEDVKLELMRLLQAEGMCQFISARSASLLLPCLMVSSGDLRTSAFHLLTDQFPWPLPHCEAYPWAEPTELLCLGMKLLNSPKARDCESGALLCKMSFMKNIIEKGMHMRDVFPRDSFQNVVSKQKGRSSKPPIAPISPKKHDDPVFHFIRSLLDSLNFQFDSFQENPLMAAARTPMYGLVIALTKCVTEVPEALVKLNDENSENARSLVEELLQTLHSICRFILNLLSGRIIKKSEEDSRLVGGPPSFSEMTAAISEVMANLSHHSDELGEEESQLLSSSEHQLIFSCSWLSLKHCSHLLSQISVRVCMNKNIQALMDNSQQAAVSSLLVDILAQCRHKGVIENCALAICKLSSAYLSGVVDTTLQSQPGALLDMALDLVVSQESSFTKKSAGLPLLVEAIITAEPRQRERRLLKRAIRRLLEIAKTPLPDESDERQDLSQAHALNTLGSLFRASVTAEDIGLYMSDVLQFTIRGFASSSFVLRNCCMQLFGILVARLFGQKKVTEEHSIMNALCVDEFFSRHRDMKDFLLSDIVGASNDLRSKDSICPPIRPSLQPVLVILSKLGPGIQEQSNESLYKAFLESLLILLSSPLYYVRQLVPRAILAFIPPFKTRSLIHQLIDGLPPSPDASTSHNKIHGELMLVEKLIETADIDSLEEIGMKLSAANLSWIGQSCNPCAWTRAVFINILTTVISKTHRPPEESILLSQRIIEQCLERGFLYQIGVSELCTAVTDLTFAIAKNQAIQRTTETVVRLLAHPSLDVRLAAIQSLQGNLQLFSSKEDLEVLLEVVFQCLMEEGCSTNLSETLNLCYGLYSRVVDVASLGLDFPQWPALHSLLLSLANSSSGTSLCACSLPVLSVLYMVNSSRHESSHWRQWITLLKTYCQPTQSETLRYAVVRSLEVAAAKCFAALSASGEEGDSEFAVSLLQCIYRLLQDEQYDIRQDTAAFVNVLVTDEPSSSRKSHQVNLVLREVMQYFCDKFRWSQSVLDPLFAWLQGSPGSFDDALSEHMNDRLTNLFEQISSNIYEEPVIETDLIAAGIEALVHRLAEGSPESVQSWLEGRYAATIREVKLMTEALAKNSVADLSFFGVSGFTKPYHSIYKLLRSLALLQSLSRSLNLTEAFEGHREVIAQQYDIIMEMHHIHPLLQEDSLLFM